MRIAATYDNGNIFQHFGHTEQFKVYEVEDGKVTASEVIGSNGAGHGALAALLGEKQIDVLICGGIGGGAQAALSERGIELCAGASGNADEAVEAYLKGELVNSGVNCNHHGEGHSCGDHGEEEHCGHHGDHEDGHHCGHHGEHGGEHEDGGCGHCGNHGGADDDMANAGDTSGDKKGTDENDAAAQGCGGCGNGGGCGGCHAKPAFEGKNVGKTVRAHYRGTFNDGTQFDSSYDRGEPLEFVCGAGMMIRGFDKAVADMEVGQVVDVHLEPAEAYGEADPAAVFTVAIAEMPGAEDLEVGQKVYLQNMYGQAFPVKATAKEDGSITFDANHEMAGKELNFRIELVEVKD